MQRSGSRAAAWLLVLCCIFLAVQPVGAQDNETDPASTPKDLSVVIVGSVWAEPQEGQGSSEQQTVDALNAKAIATNVAWIIGDEATAGAFYRFILDDFRDNWTVEWRSAPIFADESAFGFFAGESTVDRPAILVVRDADIVFYMFVTSKEEEYSANTLLDIAEVTFGKTREPIKVNAAFGIRGFQTYTGPTDSDMVYPLNFLPQASEMPSTFILVDEEVATTQPESWSSLPPGFATPVASGSIDN